MLKFIFLLSILFKQDESTSQEKIIDQEDQNETSFPTENLERQKTEGRMITYFNILNIFKNRSRISLYKVRYSWNGSFPR